MQPLTAKRALGQRSKKHIKLHFIASDAFAERDLGAYADIPSANDTEDIFVNRFLSGRQDRTFFEEKWRNTS